MRLVKNENKEEGFASQVNSNILKISWKEEEKEKKLYFFWILSPLYS
jgi:hypothetical protein